MFESNAARCPIFHALTADERDRVLALMEPHSYPRGETILREGRSTQSLWIIAEGQCEVVKSFSDGVDHQLATLEESAVFGEMSFFHPAPHSASVRALSDVKLMQFAREEYDRLQASDPEVAYKIVTSMLELVADRLRRMDEWTAQVFEKPENANHREEWREFRSKLYVDWQF